MTLQIPAERVAPYLAYWRQRQDAELDHDVKRFSAWLQELSEQLTAQE